MQTWLVQSRNATKNPLILNLLHRVDAMLEDGVLDADESTELMGILRKLSGEPSELGEIAKTSALPVDDPLPEILFDGYNFLSTGTCAFGTRRQCQEATESLGGLVSKGVNKSLHYLVLGTYVTDSWAHETFGRKIEKAIQYRAGGVPLAIVTEEHWAESGRLI